MCLVLLQVDVKCRFFITFQETDCRRECGGEIQCRNNDTIDLWVAQTGCPNVTCGVCMQISSIMKTKEDSRIATEKKLYKFFTLQRKGGCLFGCSKGKELIEISTLTPPSSPLAPPAFTPLMDRPLGILRAGAYSVNLTAAMPELTPSPPLVGFLFKVEDRVSRNVTYLWQVWI